MIVPLVTWVVRLEKVLGMQEPAEKVELLGSAQGRPALRALSGGSNYFYSLDGEPQLVATVGSQPTALSVGGVRVEGSGSEVTIVAGDRGFRGSGFVGVSGTLVYFVSCRRGRCRAGLVDVVDGLVRLYDVDSTDLRPADVQGSVVSPGSGGFSAATKSLTISVSVNGVELLPGFFRFVAGCPTGDYLVDREGFLVRVRGGVIDVLGRVAEPLSAACLSDGVVVADREGLKVVRYGAYTTVLREVVRELSSYRDVVSVVSRTGVVRILSGRDSYTLDSPMLRSCRSTRRGVACLTEDSVVFLDPAARTEVEVGIVGGRGEPAELRVRPWFEGCRLSISPRLVGVLDQTVDGGTLRARVYARVLGWEGYVRVTVECPTYRRSVDEYVRFGGLELREVVEKYFAVVESGRVSGSADHNCVGRLVLRISSDFPLPVPIEARAAGLDGASVALSGGTVLPGLNEVSVRLTGRYTGSGGVLVELATGPGLLEPGKVAAVYVDPRDFRVVRWEPGEEPEVSGSERGSVVRAPGSYLRLYCSNGRVLEGRESLTVEDCEEPALLHATKLVSVDGETFELSLSRILRSAVRRCLDGVGGERAVVGGFYAECRKYEAVAGGALHLRVEYGGGYRVSVYLGGVKACELALDPTYLLTGFSVELGPGRVWMDWRDVVKLALGTALAVGRYVEGLVSGRRDLRA